jgi:hypothetical protein
MFLPEDDLRPGLVVAVAGCADPVPQPGDYAMPPQPMAYHGCPLRILAVSLPFIVVSTGAGVLSVDTRRWKLIRVSTAYVRACQMAIAGNVAPPLLPARRRPVTVPMQLTGCCPFCHAKLRQRWLGSGRWETICPDCGPVRCQP